MNTTGIRLSSLIFIGSLIACGGEQQSPAPRDIRASIDESVKAVTGPAAGANATQPCEILDETLIRTTLSLPADVSVSLRPSGSSSRALCTASWPKPNAAELQKIRSAAMSDYLQKKMKGQEAEMPSFRTDNEVTLSLGGSFQSRAQAVSAFDLAMKRLSEGITTSHEGTEMTFQADLTPVEGVGTKAMWAPKMRQLSITDGNHIFHIAVNTGSDLEEELDTASRLARQVAERLSE